MGREQAFSDCSTCCFDLLECCLASSQEDPVRTHATPQQMDRIVFPVAQFDPSFSLLLHEKLQVPNSTRKAWNERDGRCEVCATHLSQLKQEAVHMVLSLEQCDVSPGSPPSLASLVGSRSILQGPTPPRDWPFLPTAYHSSAAVSATASSAVATSQGNSGSSHHPSYPKHGAKPNSLGVGSGMEKKSNSPGHSGKSTAIQQLHLPSSPNHTLQAHQYLEGTWASGHLSRANGVTLYPYQDIPSPKNRFSTFIIHHTCTWLWSRVTPVQSHGKLSLLLERMK
ncbi:hypothetical protein DNTS_028411 [Danionella cerebrum]|uniref:Kinesin-like protein KIF26A/B helical domain-containing protein n=1 Tax=Danionella cerebrum TaxID=2873325 RepID=A0A553RQ76_9TELE|nr:hypothetical protein DNTS_028411 [Danionella translucida]